MVPPQKIAIIGSGLAGLACARRLADTGIEPVLFDKGRGVGGRLATRRADGGLQFDHGAQYLTARSEGFTRVLCDAEIAGSIARWDDDSGQHRFVGAPGMNAFPKYLARDLDICQGHEVNAVRACGRGWLVESDGYSGCFDRVVCTAPAPQTMALLDPEHPIRRELEPVRFDPCLALMATISEESSPQFASASNPDDAIAWLARDSSKPGRPKAACWIAQASPTWSTAHLDLDIRDIEQRLVRLLCDRLQISAVHMTFSQAFRWRYARVARPLGKLFACDAAGTLYAGGDWATDARAEAAWLSGSAIADELIAWIWPGRTCASRSRRVHEDDVSRIGRKSL